MTAPSLASTRPPGGAGQPAPPPAAGSRTRSAWAVPLLLPALGLLVIGLAYPVLILATQSVTNPEWGLGNYTALMGSGVFGAVLRRTIGTAAAVCGVCLLVGYPYAYLMTIASKRWREVLLIIVLVPFWTNLMVRTFAWIVLLQDTGIINRSLATVGIGPFRLIRNTAGVTIGMAQILLPFAVLPMYAVMQKIDRRLLLAAESCGARPAAALARIYFPLALPGVLAGGSLVFIISLGFFITPQLLGSPSNALLSQLIYIEVSQLGNWGYGAAMGLVLLAATLGLLGVFRLVSRLTARTTRPRVEDAL